jgi:hypothetical protein
MKTLTNTHPDWPFSFTCPDEWESRHTLTITGRRFFLRGPLSKDESLFASITVEAHPRLNRALDEVLCEYKTSRRAFRTFRILAHTQTSLAGHEALQVDTAHEMPAPPPSPRSRMITIRERVILAVHEEKTYQICYRATQDDFDTHLPIFEALVASFSLER